MPKGFRVIETAYYFVPTLDNAIRLAKDGRGKGKYTEVITEDKYQSEIYGKINWQDLTKLRANTTEHR